MMRRALTAIALFAASTASAQPAVDDFPPKDPPGCSLPLPAPEICSDGSIGDQPNDVIFTALSKAEITAIVNAAAAALNVDTATIGVVDRTGRPLAVFRQPNANPLNDDNALGVARTTAFFSNSQAPLSSRTVRFISQVHFPPGVVNAGVGALYGIEQSNRGCDLNIDWNPGQCVVRARSINNFDKPCNSTDSSGCGAGLVTGKVQPDDAPYPQEPFNRPVEAGGIPLYRVVPPGDAKINEGIASNGRLLGAIGVYGIAGDSQLNEFAAVTGAFGALNAGVAAIIPLPSYPLPEPQNVLIEGIRLPFIGPDQKLKFNSDGLPIGLQQLPNTSPGTNAGAFTFGPNDGGCPPNGYLAGPYAGQFLTKDEVDAIVQRSISIAKKTRAAVRLPVGSYARMIITVADVDGSILAHYRMKDALFDAVDVVPSKARNVVYFNSDDPNAKNDLPGIPAGLWITGRTIGWGAQPFYPPGIDSDVFKVRQGPWYDLYLKNVANPCSQGSQAPNPNQNGVTFFGGSTPLVKNGKLVGGLGVSGDGIEQDDYVAFIGAGDLLPPFDKWSDRAKIDGVRLPTFKWPRNPQGVTECGGKPCS
jgi:uncharacterized protein GlcG (DUF336 family)